MALRVLRRKLFDQLVRRDNRGDIIEVMDRKVAKMRVTDTDSWKPRRILGFIDRVLDGTGRRQQIELRDLGRDDTVIVSGQVLSHALHLALNNALMQGVGAFRSIRIWKLHAEAL